MPQSSPSATVASSTPAPRCLVHFAGLNTAAFAEALEGEAVLVSYADVVRRPGVWTREILPRLRFRRYARVILDSGAFTELRDPSFRVDVEAYGAFALQHRDLFDAVVTLDDIRGDVERSRANTEYLEGLGLDVVPVFHQGEGWEVLADLVARYGVIGVGLQRPIRDAQAFLSDFFARVPASVKVHGFGLTRYAGAFPFATTDSTTWIAELRALRAGDASNLYAPAEGDHGVDGILRAAAASLSPRDLVRLVVASYRRAGSWYAGELAGVDVAHGQARTVLQRFSAGSFTAELLELLGLDDEEDLPSPLLRACRLAFDSEDLLHA